LLAKHLLIRFRLVRRFFRFLLLLFVAATVLPAPLPVRGVDDDDKDKPAASHSESSHPKKKRKKKSKPKPKPARPKQKKQEAEPTPHPKAQPTPEPTPTPTPAPEQTPKPSPSPSVTPSAAPSPNTGTASPPAAVIVQKSGDAADEEPAPTPAPPRSWTRWLFGSGPQYRYLTKAVRNVIDRAPVARHRWRYIVVHNSGTRQGNAKAFDYYHYHVRKMPNGLAYHFVIGNGTSSGNGAIEIGNRWVRQINGGHVHSDYLNSIALGICLVGDFNQGKPTQQQLDALDELIRYLRNRVGRTEHKLAIVKAHKDINPPRWPTDCPGDKFPYRWLYSHYD